MIWLLKYTASGKWISLKHQNLPTLKKLFHKFWSLQSPSVCHWLKCSITLLKRVEWHQPSNNLWVWRSGEWITKSIQRDFRRNSCAYMCMANFRVTTDIILGVLSELSTRSAVPITCAMLWYGPIFSRVTHFQSRWNEDQKKYCSVLWPQITQVNLTMDEYNATLPTYY